MKPSTRQCTIDAGVFEVRLVRRAVWIVRKGVNFGGGERGVLTRDREEDADAGLRQSAVQGTRKRPVSGQRKTAQNWAKAESDYETTRPRDYGTTGRREDETTGMVRNSGELLLTPTGSYGTGGV